MGNKLIVLLLIGVFSTGAFAAPLTVSPPLPTIKNIEINEQAKDYEIEINYPSLKMRWSSKIEQAINREVKSLVNKNKTSFLKERTKPFNNLNNSLSLGYQVPSLTTTVLSLKFSALVFYAGAAHPQHWIETLNFDLKTGEKLSLAEICGGNKNYLKTISDYCIKELLARTDLGPDEDWIRRGASPEASNFQYFNLTANDLIITFPDYQVAPYAAGEQEVAIGLEVLRCR
ncbi:MAG: DUF3298 domain-containing protein [Candidatus Margulisbacteria bacterium]|nr:DUF3298 domain-containing protein [Candidatus Margulisiibacteriota bacterium]